MPRYTDNEREHIKEAYYRGVKRAMPRGLESVPSGAGPDQMSTALQLLGQARALGTPTDEELEGRGISRKDFERALGRMEGKERLSDAGTNKNLNRIIGALNGATIGAGIPQESIPRRALTGLLGATAGGVAGDVRARNVNSRVRGAMKVLKDRGILSPELLEKSRPVLSG